MALTGEAKEELSHHEVSRPSARKAEAAAMLRFAGGLHLVAGRVVVEAELDSAAVARRHSPRRTSENGTGHVSPRRQLGQSARRQRSPTRHEQVHRVTDHAPAGR